MNHENLEAGVLAGLGLVRGVAEEIKSEVTLERVEAFGLACGIAGGVVAAVAIYKGLRHG